MSNGSRWAWRTERAQDRRAINAPLAHGSEDARGAVVVIVVGLLGPDMSVDGVRDSPVCAARFVCDHDRSLAVVSHAGREIAQACAAGRREVVPCVAQIVKCRPSASRAIGVASRGLARRAWPLAKLARCTQERWNRDPAKGPRPPLHHHPPRGDAHGFRPPAPGFVGCRVRRARSAPLRVGAALGPAAPSGDRADSGMGARRNQDVSVPRCGWPCHGCGKRVERSRSARRICCRPGGGGGACRRTRARCCGLRDQGRACGGPRRRG